MASTAPSTDRHVSLDVVRGVAVMAMLLMNVFFFAMPGAAYFNPRAWGGMDAPDLAAWALSFVFVEDKMRGLFSLLFGAGVLLVIERARAAGRGAMGVHYSRMFWLLIFGIANATFIAGNDILRLYAIAGIVLPLFIGFAPRLLVGAAALFAALHVAAAGYVAAIWHGVDARVAAGENPAVLAPVERAFGEDSARIGEQMLLWRGDYAAMIAERTDNPAALAIGMAGLLPQTIAFMLIGMAMLKSGFLLAAWSAERYRRWALLLFAISAPPLAAMAWWSFASDFSAVVVGANSLVWSLPFDMAMSAGWAALAMLAVVRGAAPALLARLAAVGRIAFTNYILSGLIFGFVFYGYGLGLYGRVGRIETYGFVLILWAAMLFWSPAWTARFRYGPVEWLWRSASRRRLQPMRP